MKNESDNLTRPSFVKPSTDLGLRMIIS